MMSDDADASPKPHTSMAEAVKQRGHNKAASWPGRGGDNRLEPECWPELKPKFSIAKDAKIFTMGSCFARNIEQHLRALGLALPSMDATAESRKGQTVGGSETMNIYTPTAMLQELTWAKTIRERDDIVHESDVLPLLVETAPGSYLDVHARAPSGVTYSLEQQIQRRRFIYSFNREAFDCDVAIVTLGYIEAWWDLDTGRTVEFDPKLLRQRRPERYAFRRLTFAESYDAVSRALSLILSNPRARILLTTSPVPIGVTFTNDDVVVANMHSKSVLRAVAGEIAERNERVDYFPSYESVMLTKQEEVWEDDLLHVSSKFVGKIMNRVVTRYVEDFEPAYNYEELMRFGKAVHEEAWSEAAALYPRILALESSIGGVNLNLGLAAYEAQVGLMEESRRHLAIAAQGDSSFDADFKLYFGCAAVARAARDAEAVERYRQLALADIGDNLAWFGNAVGILRLRGWSEDLRWLLRNGEATFRRDPIALAAMAAQYKADGDLEKYYELTREAALIEGDPRRILSLSVSFDIEGRLESAIDMLKQSLAATDDRACLRRLVALLLREKRFAEADEAIEQSLARDGDNEMALGLKTLLLWRLGRGAEALAAGRRALALGSHLEGVAAIVERAAARAVL